jgi:hypothetical protein
MKYNKKRMIVDIEYKFKVREMWRIEKCCKIEYVLLMTDNILLEYRFRVRALRALLGHVKP